MVERCKKKCITYGFHFYFVSSLFLKYEIYSEKYTSQSVQLVNFHKVNTAEYVPLRARKGTVPSSTKPFQTLYPLLPDVIFTSNTIDWFFSFRHLYKRSRLLRSLLYLTFLPNIMFGKSIHIVRCGGNLLVFIVVISLYEFHNFCIQSTFSWLVGFCFVLFFSLAFGCYSCYRFCQGHSSTWFFGAYFSISVGYISVHGIVGSCAYLTLVDTFDFPSDHNNLHSRRQFMRILVALPQHFGVSFWMLAILIVR